MSKSSYLVCKTNNSTEFRRCQDTKKAIRSRESKNDRTYNDQKQTKKR